MLKRQQFGLTETEKVSLPGIDELFVDDSEHHNSKDSGYSGVISLWGKSKLGTLQSRLGMLQVRSHNRKFEYSNYTIMSLANDVFGFQGWSTKLLELTIEDFKQIKSSDQPESERVELFETNAFKYRITVRARVRILLKDGTSHECEGIGRAQNLPDKGTAYRTAKMLAVSNATKNTILQLPVLLDYENVK